MGMDQKPDKIIEAACVLINKVRTKEQEVSDRAKVATLTLDVGMRGGGLETWKITIERMASSH